MFIMTYDEAQAKIVNAMGNPDTMETQMTDILKEMKVDYEGFASMSAELEKANSRIRDLQDTNHKLFLAQTGTVEEPDDAEKPTGVGVFDEFKELALPYIRQTCKSENIDLDVLVKTLQPRTELFTDIPEKVDFIDELREYSTDLYFNKKMKTTPETSLEALKAAAEVFEGIDDNAWTEENIHSALFAKIEALGVKNGWMLLPIRAALSGKQSTPGGGVELAAILGKKESLARIAKGIELLG